MTAGPDDVHGHEDRSPFRRVGFIAAGAFLVLVIAFAVAVVVTDNGGGTPGEHTSAPPSSAPASSAPPAAAGCHPTDTSQQIPQDAAEVSWSVFKTIAVPSSRTAGPMVVDGQLARCFAHTPSGALIAAWQIYVRHVFGDDWRRVTETQVMPGPGRDAFIKMRATVTGDTSDPGTYGQVAGFKFVTYSSATAVIQLVTRFSDGTMQVGTTTVVWSGGDWRLQLQPNGDESPSAQSVNSLDGFIPWGGV